MKVFSVHDVCNIKCIAWEITAQSPTWSLFLRLFLQSHVSRIYYIYLCYLFVPERPNRSPCSLLQQQIKLSLFPPSAFKFSCSVKMPPNSLLSIMLRAGNWLSRKWRTSLIYQTSLTYQKGLTYQKKGVWGTGNDGRFSLLWVFNKQNH